METQFTDKSTALLSAFALREEIRKCKRRYRNTFYFCVAVNGFNLCALLFAEIVKPKGSVNTMIGPLIGTASGTIGNATWIAFFDKKRKKQLADYKSALLEVAASDEREAIGLLLEEVHHSDFALRQAVRSGLARLLTGLQTENAPALNAKQKNVLNQIPFTSGEMNPNLRLAALRVIAQTGDAESLRVAKKNRNSTGEEERTPHRSDLIMTQRHIQISITKSKIGSPDNYVAYFQSEVADCIAALETRLARENAAETLLRAALPENAAPKTLLRPAANAASDNAALLRPASDETNDAEI